MRKLTALLAFVVALAASPAAHAQFAFAASGGGGQSVTCSVSVSAAVADPVVTVQMKVNGANATSPVAFEWALSDYADDAFPTNLASPVTTYTVTNGVPQGSGMEFSSSYNGAANKRARASTNGSGAWVASLTWSQTSAPPDPDRVWFWCGAPVLTATLITHYGRARLDMLASEPLAVSTGDTLLLTVDGVAKTIIFTVASPGAMTIAEYHDSAYATCVGCFNEFDSGSGILYGNTYTAASAIVVTGGTARAALGL